MWLLLSLLWSYKAEATTLGEYLLCRPHQNYRRNWFESRPCSWSIPALLWQWTFQGLCSTWSWTVPSSRSSLSKGQIPVSNKTRKSRRTKVTTKFVTLIQAMSGPPRTLMWPANTFWLRRLLKCYFLENKLLKPQLLLEVKFNRSFWLICFQCGPRAKRKSCPPLH